MLKTKITRKSALITALKALGFESHMIEDFGESKERLKGYHGDWRENKASIRIKGSGWSGQNYVGGYSNDLGWEKLEDGSYAFHVSDYDSKKYNSEWQEKFLNQYGKAVTLEVAQGQGYFVESEEEDEDGTIVLKLSSPF